MFSYTYKDVTVYEYSSGFALYHEKANLTAMISDGVDLFTTTTGKPIYVGTKRFYKELRHWLKSGYDEILIAYFPDLHFIVMTGLHGCLPSYCQSYDDYDSCVDDMTQLYDLGRIRRKRLYDDSYLELNLHGDNLHDPDGNEYIEITPCQCDDSTIHNDN